MSVPETPSSAASPRAPVPTTHLEIDRRLCGQPVEIAPGRARVSLRTLPEMRADARGLVHGGFVFGLADYAAMLAVGDPNVVLGAAETRFLAPVAVGETVIAEARMRPTGNEPGAERRRTVEVRARCGEETVFTGDFTCFVLDAHVLEGRAHRRPGAKAEAGEEG